jgi:uncharacterized iron-regulated membrane protein
MSVLAVLGLITIALSVAGLFAARAQPARPRERVRTTPAKSRLTLVAEVTGVAGFVLAIIGFFMD